MPTDAGPLYFKEPMPQLAHEARVLELLARRRPELVTEVLAADEQGRMLMRDGGVQLSAVLDRDPDLGYWERALPLYAELQLDCAPDAEALAKAGAYDRRGAVLPEIYERLLEEHDLLRVGLPDGLTEAEYDELRRLAPELGRLCASFAAGSVPETIQNDDFTHGSIFLSGDSYRFLDWGDACVSHPFFTLTVTLRVIELAHELPPGSAEIERIRDAYLEPFTRLEPREALVPLAVTARRFGQICRAAQLADQHQTLMYEPDALVWSLRMLLDPEIWRTFTD